MDPILALHIVLRTLLDASLLADDISAKEHAGDVVQRSQVRVQRYC